MPFWDSTRDLVGLFDQLTTDYDLVGRAKADHLCYKCESSERFDEIRRSLEHSSAFIYQSIISGRRIALIRFAPALHTKLGDITLLELSDQKPDGSQKDGFDHIEIYPAQGATDDLVAHFRNHGVKVETVVRPHHTTHDLKLGGYLVRIEDEPLLDKVKRAEMQ